MNKRTGKRQGTQGANGAGAELAEVLAPLVAGMTATRASLLEWVHAHGCVRCRRCSRPRRTRWSGPRANTKWVARITTGVRPRPS